MSRRGYAPMERVAGGPTLTKEQLMYRAFLYRFAVSSALVLAASIGAGWKWERFLP